mgnify:FL=1
MDKIYKTAFIDRFIFHTRTVQNNMIILENNLSKLYLKIKPFQLLERSLYHDLDKLEPSLIYAYVEYTKYFYNKNFGVEYIFDKQKCREITEKHYNNQRHHFYKNNKIPNIIDICEMCCDVTAISIEKKEKNNTFYYKNCMLKEYNNIKNYNAIILFIFNILWKLLKTPTYNDGEKYFFIKNRMEKIRQFQDAMIFLEKNNDKLPFKINDYEIIRKALIIDKKYLYNDYNFFDFNKNKIDELDICIFCCEYFMNKNNNLNYLLEKNENLKKFKNSISKILRILDIGM